MWLRTSKLRLGCCQTRIRTNWGLEISNSEILEKKGGEQSPEKCVSNPGRQSVPDRDRDRDRDGRGAPDARYPRNRGQQR